MPEGWMEGRAAVAAAVLVFASSPSMGDCSTGEAASSSSPTGGGGSGAALPLGAGG